MLVLARACSRGCSARSAAHCAARALWHLASAAFYEETYIAIDPAAAGNPSFRVCTRGYQQFRRKTFAHFLYRNHIFSPLLKAAQQCWHCIRSARSQALRRRIKMY
jgi:hypothetical protein